MSEDKTTTPEDQDNIENQPTKEELLAGLKRKADLLGVTYSNNIGIDSLRNRIAEAQAENKPDEETEEVATPKLTSKMAIRQKQRAEQLKLVRCRIVNMNPNKAEITGEIVTVRTKYLGTVSKMIPFGDETDNGYHIPYILYNELKSRQFLQTKVRKSKNGQQRLPISRWVNEFNIEVLPPLTPEELKKLAAQQAASAGIE
jgi:hypothetical protein